MNAKHSAGKWKIDARFLANDPKHCNYRIFAANQVCELTKPQGFYRSPAETEANARLIAAAPALLAALQACESALMLSGDRFNDHKAALVDQARAAIAKATEK